MLDLPPPTPNPTPLPLVYQLTKGHGQADYRIPGSLVYQKLASIEVRVPPKTLLRLNSDDTEVLVASNKGGQVTLKSEGIFSLPAQGHLEDSWGRTVIGGEKEIGREADIPQEGLLRKFMSFFIGKIIPAESRVSPENLLKTKLHPIKIFSPDEVALVDTMSLPATLSLSWEVSSEQQEPHKVFLWSEGQMQYAPYTIVGGGKTTIQLPAYGTFFWQVEDAAAVYASEPRTIFVKNPYGKEEQADQNSREDSLTILRPQQNTIIYNCFDKGPAKVPVWFVHENPRIKRYRVSVDPTAKQTTEVETGNDPTERYFVLTFAEPATASVKIEGSEVLDVNTKIKATDKASLKFRLENHCSLDLAPEFSKDRTNKQQTFPESGTMLLEN